MYNPSIQLLAGALLATIPTVLGHAYLKDPPAAWHQPWPTTSYGQIMDADPFGPVDYGAFGWGWEGSLKYIKAKMPTSKYKSLRDLIMDKQKLYEPLANAQCGLTVKDESKRQILPSVLTFSDFYHPGPCETWCDDTKLSYADNCNVTYPDSKIHIDTNKCKGADRLTTYWLAIHGAPWQIYIDCVYLKGNTVAQPGAVPAPQPQAPVAPEPQPQTPAPQPQTPVAPAPQPQAPVAPAPQPQTPVAPAPQPQTPFAPAPQPQTPFAPAPQPQTPVAPVPTPQLVTPAPTRQSSTPNITPNVDSTLSNKCSPKY